MILIGLGHRARQGKDTAAEAIVNYYNTQASLLRQHGLQGGLKVVVMKYAAELYHEVNLYLNRYSVGHVGTWQNFSPAIANGKNIMIPDWVKPELNPEMSSLSPYGKHPKLLQWWGTEFRRAQDPDYWVKKLFESIPKDANIVLITDVRFNNEAEAIKAKGGYLVEVVRLNQDGSRYIASDRPANHPSEIDLDDWNWDFNITSKNEVLTGEMAVTIAEYIRGLEKK